MAALTSDTNILMSPILRFSIEIIIGIILGASMLELLSKGGGTQHQRL